jgi:hypothetical protein|tara:strand:- start:54 stop:677 length:624 start_codon:yes stop_codon:yes gene_type:complete
MDYKIITYDDLMKAVFGTDDEYPDSGTPAYDIRESELHFRLEREIAGEVAGEWHLDTSEWEEEAPDTIVDVFISADEVLNTSHFGKDFCCHFTDMKLDKPATSINLDGEQYLQHSISDDVFKKEVLEKWVNHRLKVAIEYFNRFTVLGNWGAGVSAEENKSAIFCNFELKKNYSLSDLNPDWTDDEYLLEGFDDIERDSRIDTFEYW